MTLLYWERHTAKHCSTAGLLFTSQCPSGTIFLTPYSIVWDWRVSRAGPMLFFNGVSHSIPTIVFHYFPPLISVYRLVLWGCSLQTDWVCITTSAMHCRPLLIIIIGHHLFFFRAQFFLYSCFSSYQLPFSLSYFILAVPKCECFGKHYSKSPQFL